MVTTKQKFTASEIVLLAANDLTAAGNQEFIYATPEPATA